MIAAAAIAIPLLCAGLVLVRPLDRLARLIAVIAAVVVASCGAAPLFLAGPALRWHAPWAPAFGMGYRLEIDVLSGLFLIATGLGSAVGAASAGRVGHRRAYFSLSCVMLAALAGTFAARDLAMFIACWEISLVPLVALVSVWGARQRRAVARETAAHVLVGSALFTVGAAALALARGTLDLALLGQRPVAGAGQVLPALLIIAACAARLPLFPFHGWLPRLFTAAPAPVAIAAAAGMGATGVYAVLRVALPLMPQGVTALAPGLVAIAAAGALYTALLATRQDDLRARIGYTAVSLHGLCALAVFVGTATSLRGAVILALSAALVVPALLAIAAMQRRRVGSFALAGAGGLASSAPELATLATVATLGALGLPGGGVFAGAALVLVGSFERSPVASVVASLVLIVSAFGGSSALRRSFDGPPLARGRDLSWPERILVAPLIVGLILLGVAPALATDRLGADALPSIEAVP